MKIKSVASVILAGFLICVTNLNVFASEWVDYKDYYEEGISIYITSARYKAEWYWRLFKNVVIESFTNRKVPYNFFAADIFVSLKYGLILVHLCSNIKVNTH